MKLALPVILLLLAVSPVTASAASCVDTCMKLFKCGPEMVDGKPTGVEKCLFGMDKSRCEVECRDRKGGYGAVALSASSSAWGLSRRSHNGLSAADSALANCKQFMADCQVAGEFKNQCAAVARGRIRMLVAAWASAEDIETAMNAALELCKKNGGQACRVQKADCYFE